jgi:hypothetical protein
MNLSSSINMFPGRTNHPMIEALDDEPLFHSMVWACGDINLQSLPRLSNGFVRELLKAQDLVLEGMGLAQRKQLGEKCIPCWRRTTALPSPIMRMEKGREVPHPG